MGEGLLDPGVAQRVRIVTRLSRRQTVSGQALARDLGISRAAIHKHVDLLRASGVGITSSTGSGYVLEPPCDQLLPETVLALLLGWAPPPASTSTLIGLPYLYEVRTPSTNLVLKARASDLPGGAVAVTDFQEAGRGRLGRTWVCEPGKDLTFSVLLHPGIASAEAPRLVLAASVAVAEALAEIGGLEGRVGIKWPNDVQIDGRKVCGILSEASMDMDALHWVVIGVGVNVNGSPVRAAATSAAMTGDIGRATSLAESLGGPVPRGFLLIRLLGELGKRWSAVEQGRWSDVRMAYGRLDSLAGSSVVVRSGLERDVVVAEGTAEGLGPDGELRVRSSDGALRLVTAGEVTLGGI